MRLATRLTDQAKKWLADCDLVRAVIENMVAEQLLYILPVDVCEPV